jgi:hypothetical protein
MTGAGLPDRWGWASRAALLAGAAGLLLGWFLVATVAQRPDGDLTALAQFDARYPDAGWQHRARDALWLNVAGALVAWGALRELLSSMNVTGKTVDGRRWTVDDGRWTNVHVGWVLLWTGVLVAWSGWAWNQSRGWEGELFLEPGSRLNLGEDARPTVVFSRFVVPPAPVGPGRALALRLVVDGREYEISEERPYLEDGWTIGPRWYGATVTGPELAEPLFFGGDGTRTAALRDGGTAEVTADVETLEASSTPPLDGLRAEHHAILAARFAPGDGLARVGALVAAVGLVLALALGRYNPLDAGYGMQDTGYGM